MSIIEDGDIKEVVDVRHIKPGKGCAFVRIQLRSFLKGVVVEKNYAPDAKIMSAFVEQKTMVASYKEGDQCYFLDTGKNEIVPVSTIGCSEVFQFIKEDRVCDVLFYSDTALRIVPPEFVELKVVNDDHGVKRNADGANDMLVVVETGAEIRVPLSINEGDCIRINTNTGEYVECV